MPKAYWIGAYDAINDPDKLKAYAKDVGAPGKDTATGYGLIQPRQTLLGLGLNR